MLFGIWQHIRKANTRANTLIAAELKILEAEEAAAKQPPAPPAVEPAKESATNKDEKAAGPSTLPSDS